MAAMGVDGIGKGGPRAVGPTGSGPVSPADASERAGAPEAAAPAEGPQPSEALEQLRRGEIDRAAYLDARAAAAVAHLEGRLPSEQLTIVRDTLRSQLETDPVLVELVRRATAGASVGPG
jgi:hypothetical protein